MEVLSSLAPAASAFGLFAVHHSLFADVRVKQAVFTRLPWCGRIWRSLYSLTSLCLFALFYLLLPDDRLLWSVAQPWAWGFRAVQITGLILILGALLKVDRLAFIGLSQLFSRPGYLDEPSKGTLIRTGVHRYMRHPIYTGILLVVMSDPSVTQNGVFVAVLAMLYIMVGYRHEEAGLLRRFGQEYEEYRRQVPALLPRLFSAGRDPNHAGRGVGG